MENFKIENFKKDYPKKDFPNFDELGVDQVHQIIKNLSEKMGIPISSSYQQLTELINQSSDALKNFKADDDDFHFLEVLKYLGISPEEKVYLNWYRYDIVDEMAVSDVNRYFDYIWYPDADDLDIFDSSFKWILSISHYGTLKFLKLD